MSNVTPVRTGENPSAEDAYNAFLNARQAFWSAKSIVDLLVKYGLQEKAGEVIFPVYDLLKSANEQFERVELILQKLKRDGRDA